MDTFDYPETNHPPIEDIVDVLINIDTTESFVYPETVHPDIEDIIDI